MQVEFAIGYALVLADLIGLILSVLVLIALTIPLKGSTKSCFYAVSSAISFLIGGCFGVLMFSTPFPPSPYYVIGWHNIFGVFFGYLFLFLAIFQYKKDRELQSSMKPN